ncbi:MAG: hypothetical protein ABI685_12875 [Ferruginibacter sp.]
MKKYIILPLTLLMAIVMMQACKKPQHETKYITLNEIIKSGDTYSLEPGIYGDDDDVATITTQAANFSVSSIASDAVTSKNMYHFSIAAKVLDKETVVITLKENHGGRGGGRCNHDEAVITINFTVQ